MHMGRVVFVTQTSEGGYQVRGAWGTKVPQWVQGAIEAPVGGLGTKWERKFHNS